MTEIKRYGCVGHNFDDMEAQEGGEHVFYKDHAAIVAAKDARIKALEAMSVANVTPGSVVSDLIKNNNALQEQVRALAAENVLVREQSEEVYAAGYNHGHLNTADGIAYAPGTKDDFYPNALQVMAEVETPATDAVIRDIRAQAVSNLPKVGDGKEQEAFEIYARSRNLDLSQHPLHYLFLDGKTNQARSAWRECLVYVSSQLPAGEQP